MTTTMSMRERREKIERLVKQNPRVQACAHTFNEAQAHISQWHAHNDALCATNGALNELDELLTYSEAALDDLKRAKTTAYNQLMSQYPRVWDTTCVDPFDTGAQDSAAEAGAETEEMEEVPHADPLICADKLMGILDREEDAYTVTIEWCELWDLDASDVRGRLETVRGIRTQFQRLIDQTKEATNA
ncbi:hypothetical protein [Bifidobacterium pseudolongum]|uniref:Uncharacterized protein n=1 Tax=Bifidobacterium pseudolongum subsp. globosum TaxID=1690 RepID=A0A4Q5ATH3_9BIFI|nr:hypothetical protein [Bifidobacterium pseudolongum]RYQ36540.1 hypothetical protein PG2003B_1037 [Bifidobacterium pseudolongum subsp. globosum]